MVTMSGNPANTNLIGQLQLKAGLLQQFLSLGAGTVPVTSQSGRTARSVSSSLTLPPTHGITLQTSAPSISVAQPAQQSKWSSQQSTLGLQRSETEQFAGTPVVTYSYMIKFINPKRKSDYTIRTWYDTSEKFSTITNLKLKLIDTFADELSETFQLGYLEPPSQAKRWLKEQRDLDSMYNKFLKGGRITLWCEKMPWKEAVDEAEESVEPPAKKKVQTARQRSEEDLDEVFGKLKEKHPNLETAKLRLWAKLIQSGHHSDYDVPPEIPLLTGHNKKKQPKEGVADMIAGATSAIVKAISQPAKEKSPTKVQGLSPLKAVSIRRSCLDDLKRAKELFEDNVLTEEEFKEEKGRILFTLQGLGK